MKRACILFVILFTDVKEENMHAKANIFHIYHILSFHVKFVEHTWNILIKTQKKGMIAYFYISSTVFDGHLEFISQYLLPKGDQKIYDFKLFQCGNLAFFMEFVGAFM